MTDTPRFSVTIPAYNAETTLTETVASARAQTYRDFEIVICDDGSTDRTLALAESLAAEDPRIRVVSQANRGSGGAYNTAVRNARADLLVMLSADDLLMPEHLEQMDRFVREHPDASVFTCDGWYLYDDGRRERADPSARWHDPGGCTLGELLEACFFGAGAVYRRGVWDRVGGFREEFYAEDYLFWLLALAHGYTHRHLDVALSVHRRNTSQKSGDVIRMRETDVRVFDALLESGLLAGPDITAAANVRHRLTRDIRIRRALTSVLGASITERIIAATRGIRSRTTGRR